MKGLYKGKYIIAVYDKDGFLIDVACSPSQLNCFKNKKTARVYISHIAAGYTSNYIYLIDVTEKNNDVFAEEDQMFLKHIKDTCKNYYRRKVA